MEQSPTFAERIVALRRCAVSLRDVSELGAQRMDAAQELFMQRAAKNAARKEKAGR